MTDLHAEIMNIQCDANDECTYKYGQEHHHTSYKLGHRDARHAAAELSLKAEARIEELENALKELYIASGPVANCAYNVGQQHEDWENIHKYISLLDKARNDALKVYRRGK